MNKKTLGPTYSWLRLIIGIGLCIGLLAGVLVQPLGIRSRIKTYDHSPGEDMSLRQEIEQQGKKTVPALIERAMSGHCRSRERIVNLLYSMAPEEAYHAFSSAAKSPNRKRQWYAIEALGYLRNPEAQSLLKWLSESEDPHLQQIAGQALKNLNSKRQI